jgi:hypothetical protein
MSNLHKCFGALLLVATFGCDDTTQQQVDGAVNDATAKDASQSGHDATFDTHEMDDSAVDTSLSNDAAVLSDAGTSVPGSGSVGTPCTKEADCNGGFCLNLPAADPKCTTKVCTVVCPSWVVDDEKFCKSMSPTSETGDCSNLGGTISGKTVCTYKSWETQYCQ